MNTETNQTWTLMDEIARVLREWADDERPRFEKQYDNLKYDEWRLPIFKEKRDYVNLDMTRSGGAFMVEKSTGNVFCIKGYGTADRRKYLGRIQDIDGAKLYRFHYMRPNMKQPIAANVPGPAMPDTRRLQIATA